MEKLLSSIIPSDHLIFIQSKSIKGFKSQAGLKEKSGIGKKQCLVKHGIILQAPLSKFLGKNDLILKQSHAPGVKHVFDRTDALFLCPDIYIRQFESRIESVKTIFIYALADRLTGMSEKTE